MNDAAGFLVSAIGLILVPVCLFRLLLGRADLSALYRAPAGNAWPRGIQEGDCPRWRLDAAGTTVAAEPTSQFVPRVAAAAELLACTASELATFGPAAPDPPRGLVVQPRVLVHGRVGLAGGGSRAWGRAQPRAAEGALAPTRA